MPAGGRPRAVVAQHVPPVERLLRRKGVPHFRPVPDSRRLRGNLEATVPVAQFSSARYGDGSPVADLGSSLPVNFSGQVVAGTNPSLFTVGGWIRFLEQDVGESTIFSVADQFQLTMLSSGALSATFVGGGSVASDIEITDQGWHFVACSFQQSATQATSGVLELYIDGSQTASGEVLGSSSTTPADCQVGPDNDALDVVSWCVWSVPLSSDVMDVPFWGDPHGGIDDPALVVAADFAGGTAADVSGNGVPVTAGSLVWHTTCLQLENASVTPAPADGLAPGGPATFSVAGWALLDDAQSSAPLWATGTAFSVVITNGQVQASWAGTAALSAPAPTGWTHVAVTYDGSSGHLYLNGQLSASQPVTAPTTTPTGFVIGGDGDGNLAQGLSLQGVSVWTVCLTPAQVVDALEGGLPLGEAGCVGFFPFTDDSEQELGNLVTLNASTASGQASINVVESPVDESARVTLAATPDSSGPALVRLGDLRRLAAQAPQEAVAAVAEDDVAAALAWYEQFVASLSPALAARLRAEFAANLRLGSSLANAGSRVGTFELRIDGTQTVATYHTEQGPQEVGRLDDTLSPYLQWVVTIFLDIAGIVAAMFGILTTAAKVTKAVGLLDDLYEPVGAAAQAAPGTGTARACAAIWNVIKVLWEWKAIGSLIWQLVKASWWSIAFTVASLVAQVAALVATGGWLIAVKVAQMAVAIGNLVKDLLQAPTTDAGHAGQAAPA
jgi:hypothetical protein